jgi:hypothetical protein
MWLVSMRRPAQEVAADRQRPQGVAVIALAPGDEAAALGLALVHEVLADQLDGRLVGLGAAGDEIDPAQLAWRPLDQVRGQVLGSLGGEEVGVGVGDLVELVLDRLDHRAVAADRHGIAVARRAVKDPALTHGQASPASPGDAQTIPLGLPPQKPRRRQTDGPGGTLRFDRAGRAVRIRGSSESQPCRARAPESEPMDLSQHIRTIPDFPKPGILFYDISTLLIHPQGWQATVERLAEAVAPHKPDVLVGIESRGFLVAAPLALKLGLGFMMVRKKGKLPGETVRSGWSSSTTCWRPVAP